MQLQSNFPAEQSTAMRQNSRPMKSPIFIAKRKVGILSHLKIDTGVYIKHKTKDSHSLYIYSYKRERTKRLEPFLIEIKFTIEIWGLSPILKM